MQEEYYRTSMHGSAARAALRPATKDEIIDALVKALESTKRVAAAHMRARGYSVEDIADGFPQADAALALASAHRDAQPNDGQRRSRLPKASPPNLPEQAAATYRAEVG